MTKMKITCHRATGDGCIHLWILAESVSVLSVMACLSTHNYAEIFLLKHILQFAGLILSVYLKHILILILHLMIKIWKYPVITWYGLIILQTINEEVFVYIINIFYLWEFSMFNICKNALILKWKLATKFVTLYLFIDLPVKL